LFFYYSTAGARDTVIEKYDTEKCQKRAFISVKIDIFKLDNLNKYIEKLLCQYIIITLSTL